ncbi:MAG: porin [Planctomycetota bacterium]|nr:porin [Planctomycetota bacterium]
MQTVKLIICAVVFLTASLAQAKAYDQFAADATCASAVEASCDCPKCSREPMACDDCQKIFKTCGILDQWGISLGGHLQQGVTTNSRNPTNPPAGVGNFPATQWNYRNDEYMLNQLLLTVGRETDTDGCGWDIGGEVDIVYGTDYIFLQSRGLETRGDLTNHWNSDEGVGNDGNGLMGIALPQMYLEVAHDDLTVMLGHFYHPLGYERRVPTENDYYSNTYGFTFSFEQFQVTGVNADWKLNDRVTIGGGFTRGMENWEDNNDNLNGFGVLNWTSCDDNTSFSFVFDIGKEDDAGRAIRYLHSVIFETEIHDRWSYVFYSDFGFQQDALAGGGTAYWYNIVQYVAYQINPCWTAGIRFEWFDDIDGFIVDPTPGPGVFYDLTLGLNYKPNDNVILRPEVRWDWFDADPGVGPGPFGDGTERSQFMAAVDVIFTF